MEKYSAKDIRLKLIDAKSANKFVKQNHYSGKVVPNSQLHFGVFLNGKLEGVMQYGPPMMRKNMLSLIRGLKWYDFLELNRMAFSDRLPRNSESRAIAISLKIIKKHKPNMKMIISFADGCQCGDGTIYRASGFYLSTIKQNKSLKINPKSGEVISDMTLYHHGIRHKIKDWQSLHGFQLRYIYVYQDVPSNDFNFPILPFSKIEELGIGMYKGKKVERASRI